MDSARLLVAAHAVLGVALVTLGFFATRSRKSARSIHPRVGEAYFWLLVVTLTSGMLVGARSPAISVFEMATPPTLLLGILGYAAVKRRPRLWLGRPWLHWHIFGMGGSYIGVVTATLFQIVPRALEAALPPPLLPPGIVVVVLLFATPAVVGTGLINRAQRKWVKTFPVPRTVPAPA